MNLHTLIFAAALAFPAPAYAYFDTGNDLYESCNTTVADPHSGFKFGMCAGYLRAVADNLNLATDLRSDQTCIPGGADNRQLIDVVVKYMADHPERRDMPAVMLADLAFINAWPKCASYIPTK